MRYVDYVKTNHWKALRNAKLRSKKKCEVCKSKKGLNVHHLNYKGWFDVEIIDLMLLCERCHKLVHRLMKRRMLLGYTSQEKRKEIKETVKLYLKK